MEPPKKLQKVSNDNEGKSRGVVPATHNSSKKRNNESEGEEDEDDEDEVKKVKWNTLEHHGVIFSESYKPHGVPILHKGNPIKLTPEQEEACNYWA